MKVERAQFQDYSVFLQDKYRPPSRGGNKAAWHSHVLTIDGEKYSFLAPWRGKFVYKREKVSFDWDWDETGKYRNIDRTSVVAWSSAGEPVVRGNRGSKEWRTADTRLPGRRSDWDN